MTAKSKAAPTHKTVTGVDPDKPYEIPGGFGEFWAAEDLQKLAARIIEKKLPDFPDCSVAYVWKAKGGITGGNEIWGKTNPSDKGLLGFWCPANFVIWLAADHVENNELSHYQVEALLYHELLHIVEEEDDAGNKKLTTRGHDFEGFISEIEEYGFWKNDAKRMAKAMTSQLELFGASELELTQRSADNGAVTPIRTDILDPDDLPEEPIEYGSLGEGEESLAALQEAARIQSEAAAEAQLAGLSGAPA